ncbi:hypothetical protein CMO86_05915 [Candidatus Woesearchaeota archaeon]|nr:hypothetical protein [Candidatus Woesearchaeota archaeon]
MMGFLKPHVTNQGLLDNTPGDPDGYVTRDGMWAAIPWAGKRKGFAIIHNGRQVHDVKTYKQALAYIKKQSKIKTTSSLEEFL